jgi:hypothetical protein
MLYKTAIGIVMVGFIFLQSCGGNVFKEDVSQKQQIQAEQYQPYKIQNTLKGYQEFISQYPDNMFVEDARKRIADLEFAPYEKADTIEGYMEFKARYPDNPHCADCDTHIERLECKRCEEIDTIESYEAFLFKYPESTFSPGVEEKLAARKKGEEQADAAKIKPLQQEESTPVAKMDGQQIMTMVHKRDRAEDFIISTSWNLTRSGRRRHSTVYMEKRKNFGGREGFHFKSVIRYLNPPDSFGNAILTWNHTDNQRLFWTLYFRRRPTRAQRSINAQRIRPPAQADFNLGDYYDINLDEEKHKLFGSEMYEDTRCFIVESTPLSTGCLFGKRIIWIDQENFIPLKIEYFDRQNNPWKTLYITWQKKYGFWFWKKAEVINQQAEIKTFISIDDLRVNLGLPDRDFTRNSLERMVLGF